jgi:TonB family protein
VEVSGAERTTFYPTVEATAKQFKLAIRPDAHPEAGHYYRSDHFSLARVGIPSFSINEGLKYAGHDDAWGEAQAKDYVEHHYHQPSDEYSAAMDFQGDALIAEFGYALGRRAAEAPAIPEWLQGDEFEKAKKNARPGNTDLSALFIGMPELHLIHSEPLGYPPLARLTRITGKVVIHVTVGSNGYVQETTISKGHPLLRDPVEQNVKKWRFEPLASQSKEFDLTVEFVLAFRGSYPQGAAFVGGPLALVILGSPPPLVETMSSAKN